MLQGSTSLVEPPSKDPWLKEQPRLRCPNPFPAPTCISTSISLCDSDRLCSQARSTLNCSAGVVNITGDVCAQVLEKQHGGREIA